MFALQKAFVRSRTVAVYQGVMDGSDRVVVGTDPVRHASQKGESVVVDGQRVGKALECVDSRAELSAMFGEFVFHSWGDLGVNRP